LGVEVLGVEHHNVRVIDVACCRGSRKGEECGKAAGKEEEVKRRGLHGRGGVLVLVVRSCFFAWRGPGVRGQGKAKEQMRKQQTNI
jgi:hypothetical protein